MPTKTRVARYARFGLEIMENIGLMVIAIATVIAGYQEVMLMINNGAVTLADLLLMFLYLEVLAMVGLYYKSGKLPVRFPLYIAMAALARFVILGQGTRRMALDRRIGGHTADRRRGLADSIRACPLSLFRGYGTARFAFAKLWQGMNSRVFAVPSHATTDAC